MPAWGQPDAILGSTWGRPWVNLGSNWGQAGIKLGSTWAQCAPPHHPPRAAPSDALRPRGVRLQPPHQRRYLPSLAHRNVVHPGQQLPLRRAGQILQATTCRERDASACIRRHQAFALSPLRERRCHVYEEAPGFRPGPCVINAI